jgi:hypothetical protein
MRDRPGETIMKRRILLTAAFAVIVGSMSIADLAEAKIKIIHFKGTRDQVRAACDGGVLVEGKDQTYCGGQNGRGVTCWDDGRCIGTGARPTGGESYQAVPGPVWLPMQSYQPGTSVPSAGMYRAP